MTRHRYGISALISHTSFRGETSGGVYKCQRFPHAVEFDEILPVRHLSYTLSNKILHQALLGFTSVCKSRIQSLFSNNAGQCIILPPQSYRQKSNSHTIFTLYKIAFVAGIRAGADAGFFLGGGALVPCSTSTPINPIVFFFAEYQLY